MSITRDFNASTTEFNPAWTAIIWLWLLLDLQDQVKEEKRLTQAAIQHNRKFKLPKPG